MSTDDWRAWLEAMAAMPGTASPQEKAERGRRLERLLYAMFDEAGFSPRLSFRPKGEEIDGSFQLDGRTLLLEAKWTGGTIPASAMYQFMGKVSGKLVGTIGLFVSMTGFSPDAVDALKAGKELNLILMDGDDLRYIADQQMEIAHALRQKLRAASEYGTPFLPLRSADSVPTASGNEARQLILVEGRFDERLVRAMIQGWGERADQQSVIAVGGPLNFASTADAFVGSMDTIPKVLILADGDGQPELARRQIEREFELRLPELEPKVVIAEPTLEAVLGLFAPGEFAKGRRKVLALDDKLLLSELRKALGKMAPGESKEASNLLKALGIQISH